MSVLIKGMEMPESCRDCELGGVYVHCDDNGVYTEEKHRCSVTFYPLKDLAKRHEKCPLIEVPTPHGRLIDADALIELYEPASEDVNEWEHYTTTISVIRQNINDAPTVIEAEEANND